MQILIKRNLETAVIISLKKIPYLGRLSGIKPVQYGDKEIMLTDIKIIAGY